MVLLPKYFGRKGQAEDNLANAEYVGKVRAALGQGGVIWQASCSRVSPQKWAVAARVALKAHLFAVIEYGKGGYLGPIDFQQGAEGHIGARPIVKSVAH